MNKPFRFIIGRFLTVFTVFSLALPMIVSAQKYDSIEKGRMKDMLKIVKSDIKEKYYDATYKGIDLEAKFKTALDKIDQTTSSAQAMGIIAQAVIDFNDSHLYLQPPSTNLRVDYGWRYTYFGDKCVITDVKPKSDAEAKGLKRGDQIVAIGGFRVSRKEMWKVSYYYNVISKRNGMKMTIISPGAEAPRDIEFASELKQQPKTLTGDSLFRIDDDFYNEENDKHRFVEVGGIRIWRMPGWDFDPSMVDSLMARVKDGTSIIMDLRQNGGGYVKDLEAVSGIFVTKDTQIAELKGRKPMEPIKAKTRGDKVYKGKLVVLIDSESGSASEIFAKFVQLEKLGVVIGDVSGGNVMQSRSWPHSIADDSVFFAVSVTNADVIMSDGKSIEHVGVTPDILVIPTLADVAAGRDVVMQKAIQSLGGTIDPIEAGKWFPYFWKKN